MATQKPCFLQFFQTLTQVGTSSGIIIPAATHLASQKRIIRDRPFLPLYGVKVSAVSGYYEPVTVASNKANAPATFRQLGISAYMASKGAAVDGASPNASFFTEGRFDQYLYSTKLGDDVTKINRYKANIELVADFFNNLDAAATAQQYQDQLTKLRELVLANADKELYISPGDYFFNTLDPFAVAFSAWFAADADLVGIAGIELNSI